MGKIPMKTIAVILAGGIGSRFGAGMPKQMVPLDDKPILRHTLEAFAHNARIDSIVVVAHMDIIQGVHQWIPHIKTPTTVIQGGTHTRLDSTYEAVQYLRNFCRPDDKILCHDSVRPFVSQRIIQDCVDALDTYDAITVGVPMVDTLMHVQGGTIQSVPNRADYMAMQTPQGFRFGILQDAYKTYDTTTDGDYTDDCGFVRAKIPHIHVGIVQGEPSNIKITTHADLYVADGIYQNSQ